MHLAGRSADHEGARSEGEEYSSSSSLLSASPQNSAAQVTSPCSSSHSNASAVEDQGVTVAQLRKQLREKEAQKVGLAAARVFASQELQAIDAFKFEQILRACVAQQAETIENLNSQLAEAKRGHEAAVRAFERRIRELESRAEALESLRTTASHFIASYTAHALYKQCDSTNNAALLDTFKFPL